DRRIARNQARGAAGGVATGIAHRPATASRRHERDGGKEMSFPCLTILPFALLFCVTLAGCHARTADPAEASGPEKMSLFQKGKGIRLPAQLIKEFGVETIEVAQKPLPRRVTKTARVYRAAQGGSPASVSVLVTAEEAKELQPGQPVALRRPP